MPLRNTHNLVLLDVRVLLRPVRRVRNLSNILSSYDGPSATDGNEASAAASAAASTIQSSKTPKTPLSPLSPPHNLNFLIFEKRLREPRRRGEHNGQPDDLKHLVEDEPGRVPPVLLVNAGGEVGVEAAVPGGAVDLVYQGEAVDVQDLNQPEAEREGHEPSAPPETAKGKPYFLVI